MTQGSSWESAIGMDLMSSGGARRARRRRLLIVVLLERLEKIENSSLFSSEK